jgi:hypothetical protein
MDELTSALDPSRRAALGETLRELARDARGCWSRRTTWTLRAIMRTVSFVLPMGDRQRPAVIQGEYPEERSDEGSLSVAGSSTALAPTAILRSPRIAQDDSRRSG